MGTALLNDDGSASMATALLCSHHAFRRDLACFRRARTRDAAVLAEEWRRFRETLHHHHVAEDTGIFPSLRPRLGAALDRLEADHRAIDPLLERADDLSELDALLAEHLEAEERLVIPYLRDAKEFPLPSTDAVVAEYAAGFAWACAGISERVLDALFAMLPPALVVAIPAARSVFDDRCREVWGRAHEGTSLMSVPGE